MTNQSNDITGDESFSLKRRAVYGTMAFIAVTVVGLLVAEALLRVLPIPGLQYQTFHYDPLTGGTHYPQSTVMYRGGDGTEVERRVNSWGFLDVEQDIEKPAGVTRIAFFGDSYTEARQVELEDTFFRRVQSELEARNGPAVEVMALGVAGRSTLQSWLEWTRWRDRAGIDVVVYVFSENDPGDQLRAVTGIDVIPYAELSGDTFVVDDAFRQRYAYKASRLHRALRFLKARSLVISTIEQRLRLLRRHGVRVETGAAEGVESREAGLRATAPSTWPPDLVATAETLGERIIRRWRDDVEASGARFVIARIPRESQVGKPATEQDSWAAWLESVCVANGIPLIDPTPVFRRAMRGGEAPYGDHLTPLGHRLFADVILEHLESTGF